MSSAPLEACRSFVSKLQRGRTCEGLTTPKQAGVPQLSETVRTIWPDAVDHGDFRKHFYSQIGDREKIMDSPPRT